MGTLKIALAAIFLFATLTTVLSSASTHENKKDQKQIHDLKDLPWKQRIMLHMLKTLNPKALEKLPKEVFVETSARQSYQSVDNFFIDTRQLLTQASKIDQVAELPEFHWLERLDFCVYYICFDMELSLITKDSKYDGAEGVTTSTSFTPTSFSNTFRVPYFNWTSPGFTFNYTDYDYGAMLLYQNTFVSLEDITIIFVGDYKHAPEVGIQIDNLAIYFKAGKVSWRMQDITQWDFDGNLMERWGPVEYFSERDMMNVWTWAKKEYVPGLQYSLNCFLSNDRSDPQGCAVDDTYFNWSDYYRYTNMQLIQSIGLGALLSP